MTTTDQRASRLADFTTLAFSALALSAPSLGQGAPEFPTSQLLVGEMRDLLQVESADVDGDGVTDLIGYSDASNALMWQRGSAAAPLGPDRFGPPQTLLELPDLEVWVFEPRLFEIADVTGDGLEDVVLSNRVDEAIQLIENLGGGDVAAPLDVFDTTPSSGTLLGAGTTAFDADGDGDLDLALFVRSSSGAANLSSLLENVGGSFVARPLPGSVNPGYFAAADVDGDGDLDLATSGENAAWLRNDSGAFTRLELPNSPIETNIAVARDFDGDGDLDLGFDLLSDSVLALYENLDGLGTFGDPKQLNRDREPVATVDMDGDGDLDFLTTTVNIDLIEWTALEPGLTPGTTVTFALRNGSIRSMEAVDLDADGFDDLLIHDEFRGQSAYQGQPSPGQLALGSIELEVARKFGSQGQPVARDFDLDGNLDLVVPRYDIGVTILFLDSNGDIARTELIPNSVDRVQELEIVDVNADGRLDIVLVELTGPIYLYLGQPGGTVAAPIVLDRTGRYRSVEAIDLDQDGDLDIIGGGSIIGDRDLVAFDQIAPGQFSTVPRVLTSFVGSIYSVETADLDLDGMDDLCVSVTNTTNDPRHFLCRSVGDGTIERNFVQVAFDQQPLIPVDLDGDGDSDFVWVDDDGARVLARENVGGGSVSDAFTILDTGQRFAAPVPAHLNTDGIPDFLIRQLDGDEEDRQFYRMLSNGTFSYGSLEALTLTDSGVTRALAADVDDDSDVDVFGFATNAGSIELYRSTLLSDLGVSECGPAVPNSTGAPGALSVRGSSVAETSALLLTASSLPPASLTLFLTSQDAGFVSGPGGSSGNLCLGGTIGRFLASGGPQTSDPAGSASLGVNLRELPQPNGTTSAMAGQTWRFQAWHRDAVGGQTTSNFTQAVAVSFL